MRTPELEIREDWDEAFHEEANRLQYALGSLVIEVLHVGSTAIPGLLAVPVIDMILVVSEIEALDRREDVFKALGYEPMGECGISGRRFYYRGRDCRTHHIHAYQAGSSEIERHVAFRDYLRANDRAAREYEAHKLKLAEHFRDAPEKYAAGKTVYIQKMEREALAWMAS